jgi:HTH-type transcriptional regulator / antitoxin HigA
MNDTYTGSTVRTLKAYASLVDFAPDWLVKPGDTIADVLEERGWTQTELAKRTGFTTKHIHQLLKGDAPITQETAAKLEKVLGSTVRFWVGLDTQYREQLAKRDELKALAKEADWLKELPLSDMVRFGWVAKLSDKAQQVRECLKFFAVSSVSTWRETYTKPVAAYRASTKLKMVGPSVAAWLRQGERGAAALRCEDFDQAAFERALVEVRALTRIASPKEFLPKLTNLCAGAGVAVVLAPAPKGCPVNGATKWLAPNKALIMLSVRGKTDDKLWFTFFHEAGHLVKHGKSLTFLDILGDVELGLTEETEANNFARDWLVPPNAYDDFLCGGTISANRVKTFAAEQGVSPGIVVGRLQFDKRIPFTYMNALKVTYVWNHEKK